MKKPNVIEGLEHLHQVVAELGPAAVFNQDMQYWSKPRYVKRNYAELYCDQHPEPKLIMPIKTCRNEWIAEADHNKKVACCFLCANHRRRKNKGVDISDKSTARPVILHKHDPDEPQAKFLYGIDRSSVSCAISVISSIL